MPAEQSLFRTHGRHNHWQSTLLLSPDLLLTWQVPRDGTPTLASLALNISAQSFKTWSGGQPCASEYWTQKSPQTDVTPWQSSHKDASASFPWLPSIKVSWLHFCHLHRTAYRERICGQKHWTFWFLRQLQFLLFNNKTFFFVRHQATTRLRRSNQSSNN